MVCYIGDVIQVHISEDVSDKMVKWERLALNFEDSLSRGLLFLSHAGNKMCSMPN